MAIWTGHATIAGLVLLGVAVLVVLSFYQSFISYLIILVYVRGVLILLLYLSVLSINLILTRSLG